VELAQVVGSPDSFKPVQTGPSAFQVQTGNVSSLSSPAHFFFFLAADFQVGVLGSEGSHCPSFFWHFFLRRATVGCTIYEDTNTKNGVQERGRN